MRCRQVTVKFKDKSRLWQEIGLNQCTGATMLEIHVDALLLTVNSVFEKDNEKKLLKSINFSMSDVHEFTCEQIDLLKRE